MSVAPAVAPAVAAPVAAAAAAPAPPDLLDCMQSLALAERGLSLSIERTAPLLLRSSIATGSIGDSSSNTKSNRGPRLLPTPRSMDEARVVLAVSRSYSSRTSAPAGWRPTLPVFGFATPNPLPHQLRGGALGALQLKLAKEERSEKRRKREDAASRKAREERQRREEGEREKEREKERARETEGDRDADEEAAAAVDPKRRELNEMRRHIADDAKGDRESKKRRFDQEVEAARARAQAQRGDAARTGAGSAKTEAPATMNLSDTSSDDDDDDDDDDDENSAD